jgi:hypothetical protein
MTIQQTIDIPADRRVHFEFLVPQEIPTGVAEVAIIFSGAAKPKTATTGKGWRSLRGLYAGLEPPDAYLEQRQAENELEYELEKEAAAKTAKRVAEGRRPFEGLRGSLQNSGIFSGDPVEIIRKMRDEW